MLSRRLFLGSGLSAVGAGLLARAWSSDAAVDPRTFGAIGNGKANDTAAVQRAVQAAFRTRRPLDGGNATFAVSGNLEFNGYDRPWIQSLRLRQLTPSNDRKTLHFARCQAIRIDHLEIDVGSSRSVGYFNQSGGLWIEGGANHNVSDVTVFGDGKNSLIGILRTSTSTYTRLNARDAAFDDPGANDDVMQGIFLAYNADCVFQSPTVSNLTGNASFRGKHHINLRTRGMALGGNSRCTIIDPTISQVDQGIDISGDEGNLEITVRAGSASRCVSAGLKFANSAVGCSVSGFTSEKCGSHGVLVSGPSGPGLRHKTSSIDVVDCRAVDIGYAAPTGSRFGFSAEANAFDISYPKRIRFIRCHAIDSQPVKTMKYGFYTNVPPPADPADANQLLDCTSSGEIVAPQLGSWRIG